MSYVESWANVSSEGYFTSFNSALGKLIIGQGVDGWRSPDLNGVSPVKKSVPTIIDTTPIITWCSNIPAEDRTLVDTVRDTLFYSSWTKEEYLNFYLDENQEVFNRSVYWLSIGGSLWDGGVYLAVNASGAFYIGVLFGKYARTIREADPVTGEITVTTTYHYSAQTLTLSTCEYLYFSQYWQRVVDGDNTQLLPPISGNQYKTIICHWGNYPIPFKSGHTTESPEGSGHYIFTETDVPFGALSKDAFNTMYLTNYTDYNGIAVNTSQGSFARGLQDRANGHRFGFGYLADRPDLATNERWTSGNAIWNPTPDDDGDGSGSGGAPGSASGGGYNPNALKSDEVGIPALPSKDVASSKVCGVYHLTDTALDSLTNWLWSSNFFDSILKNFSSPMENIVSLGLVPYSSFYGVSSSIVIGNVVSEISAIRLSRTMYELDCGTIDVEVPYESFGSFEPFSTYSLYLPYIGVVDLPSDDIAPRKINGKLEYGQVNVVYHFDVFSGACLCYVRTCTNHQWNVLSTYSGNLLTSIPISQTNFLQVYQTLISTRANISSMGANAVSTFMSPGVSGMVSGAGNLANQFADTVNQAIGIRPSYSRTGTLSNVHGQLGIRTPFLIKTTGRLMATDMQRNTQGYVSNLPITMRDQKGFVKCRMSSNRLEGFAQATDNELAELKSIMSSGIYIN